MATDPKATPAQPAPVQEPVAWCSQCGHVCPQTINQEPIGWWDAKLGFFEEKHFDQLQPLYTIPPAQEIVCSTGLCHYKPAAAVQSLPFGVGGGLVAIKTLLSRDPCVHANTAIEMLDAILKEHPAAQRPWVGLTDNEKIDCASPYDSRLCCVEATEAKLKEKNT